VADQQKIREGAEEEKALSGEAKFLKNATEILGAIIFLSLFYWINKEENHELLFQIFLPLLFVIEIMELRQYLKEADYGDFVFEGAHFLVVLSIFWYFFTKPHVGYFLLLLTSFCYRTDRLRHNSRNFAAVVSILIPLAVLPVTLRWVTDELIVTYFLILYALLVASLWFSKLASWYSEI